MKKLRILGASLAALALVGAGCSSAPAAPAAAPVAPQPVAQAPAPPAPVQKFQVGARVESRWKDGTIWYKGTIAAFAEGKYAINYDDSDKESGVPEERIRALADAPAQPVVPAAKEIFPVGDKVVAKWKNGNQWYPGKVTDATNGKYSIDYDDGSKEAGLDAPKLAHLPTKALTAKVGDAIIAKWKDGRWYTASVTAVAGAKISVKFYDGYTMEVSGIDIAVAGK